MDNYDWSKFTKRVSIKRDKKVIFNYLSTQDNIEKWFLSQAKFISESNVERDRHSEIKQGDKYIWMWHGSDDVAEGEIIENNNVDFVKFTFLGDIVSMKVKTESNENIVELIQSEIPLDETSRMNNYVGCSRGWTFYLTNLKSIIEGGIDLRNRNKELIDVINT